MKDYLVKAYAFDGTVRIYAAATTNLVNDAQKIHDTWPTASAAFGRVLTASVIMGAMYKDDQSITVRIDGKGPIGQIVVDANAHGQVRGYLGNPKIYVKYAEGPKKGKLNVGYAVGNQGFIHVTKDLKIRNVFTSSAPLQTGEIGNDFTYYFAASEQIPSSVSVGVLVEKDYSIKAAGGFILQLMPGCKDETISLIEKRLQGIPPISSLVNDGYTPEKIIEEITKGDHQFLHTLDLEYYCSCTKDKFEKGLISLGKVELNKMIEEDGQVETTCHFCRKQYLFEKNELEALKKE